MSNRPIKKKKPEIEITEEDFNVEWTPPPRTARDRIIQVGVLILIGAFLLPAITCAKFSGANNQAAQKQQQQQQQQDPIEQQIKQYAQQVAANPKDPAALANLGLYTTFKAAQQSDEKEKMTLLVTAEKYLRDALAQDENYALATRELARNLYLQDKKDKAQEVIDAALTKADEQMASKDEKEVNAAKSSKVDLLNLSAAIVADQGNKEEALKKLGEAIELKPGEPSLYLTRAQFKVQFGDKEAAKKDIATAVDIGQKIGDQQSVARGQQMMEALDNPNKGLEVTKVETEDVSASPSPSPAK